MGDQSMSSESDFAPATYESRQKTKKMKKAIRGLGNQEKLKRLSQSELLKYKQAMAETAEQEALTKATDLMETTEAERKDDPDYDPEFPDDMFRLKDKCNSVFEGINYMITGPSKWDQYLRERYGKEQTGEMTPVDLPADHPLTDRPGAWDDLRMESSFVRWDSAEIGDRERGYYNTGTIYEGQVTGHEHAYRAMAPHGLGVMTFGPGSEPGFDTKQRRAQWTQRAHGFNQHGREFHDGERYEGEFRNGLAHGFGVFKSEPVVDKNGRMMFGKVWAGQWMEGMKHGCGIELDGHEYFKMASLEGTSKKAADHFIKSKYGMWKFDLFGQDALLPWEYEPRIVAGQHHGRHDDIFDENGFPTRNVEEMSYIVAEQRDNYMKRRAMQDKEFANYVLEDDKMDYCRIGDTWTAFQHAIRTAKMATMFERKPGGMGNLLKSFSLDFLGDLEPTDLNDHPLFYQYGTQCLMPGPLGQLYPIQEKQAKEMREGADWYRFIHDLHNYDKNDPPFPRGFEERYDMGLMEKMKEMQKIRDEKTRRFEAMQEEMKEKIEKDEGVKDENHLKFMKWVLQFPKPKRYPTTLAELNGDLKNPSTDYHQLFDINNPKDFAEFEKQTRTKGKVIDEEVKALKIKKLQEAGYTVTKKKEEEEEGGGKRRKKKGGGRGDGKGGVSSSSSSAPPPKPSGRERKQRRTMMQVGSGMTRLCKNINEALASSSSSSSFSSSSALVLAREGQGFRSALHNITSTLSSSSSPFSSSRFSSLSSSLERKLGEMKEGVRRWRQRVQSRSS